MTGPVVQPPPAPAAEPTPVPEETAVSADQLIEQLTSMSQTAWRWLQAHVLTTENLIAIGIQVIVILVAILIGAGREFDLGTDHAQKAVRVISGQGAGLLGIDHVIGNRGDCLCLAGAGDE